MLRRGLLLLAFSLLAQSAGAQSLFGVRGLGVPVDPIDPRGRALGSSGVGLLGLNLSMVNPAELAGIRRRGVVAALQPFYGSEELGGNSDNVAGTRFPLIQLLYPARQGIVLGLGFGGFLEQSWSTATDGQEIIAGGPVNIREFISATGAISQVRLSVAYDLSTPLELESIGIAVGLSGGVYTGGVEREVTRTFPDSGTVFLAYSRLNNWEYRGNFATLGIGIEPTASTKFGASLTLSQDLRAKPRQEDLASHSYEMPLRVNVGASTLLTRLLLIAGSAQYTGWSKSASYTPPGTSAALAVAARPTFDAGVGLEWERLRTSRRVFPLRAGVRYSHLPFHQSDEDPASELVFSTGVGLRLAADDIGPLAIADIGVERGRRTGWAGTIPDGLTENFWRLSASISLFGR
jgi:hypothetical protein